MTSHYFSADPGGPERGRHHCHRLGSAAAAAHRARGLRRRTRWTGARPYCSASRPSRPASRGSWTSAAATAPSRWPSPRPAPEQWSMLWTSTSGRWQLCRDNAAGARVADRVHVLRPEEADPTPATTRSGPTHRSGSARRPLHALLLHWLARLRRPAWPGSWSARTWAPTPSSAGSGEQGYAVERAASAKGFRVLVVPSSGRTYRWPRSATLSDLALTGLPSRPSPTPPAAPRASAGPAAGRPSRCRS